MKNLPLVAAVVAFLLAAIGLLAAFQQPVLVLFALVPLWAGIGILRKQVWSAYGFALFELAQLTIPLLVASHAAAISKSQIGLTIGLNLFFALLFFVAGRQLAVSGARKGYLFPWVVACCLFTLPLLFVHAFVIPSGGMEDTLLIGDRVLARVFPRIQPVRGDIVVFHYPMDRRQVFVKRVIGLPGDRIRIEPKKVFRNGDALIEPYATYKFAGLAGNRAVHSEVVVPPGKYFVLGDNRDNSLDSRYWGFLDAADIVGKPMFIYDSSEPAAAGSFKRTIRWRRLFKVL